MAYRGHPYPAGGNSDSSYRSGSRSRSNEHSRHQQHYNEYYNDYDYNNHHYADPGAYYPQEQQYDYGNDYNYGYDYGHNQRHATSSSRAPSAVAPPTSPYHHSTSTSKSLRKEYTFGTQTQTNFISQIPQSVSPAVDSFKVTSYRDPNDPHKKKQSIQKLTSLSTHAPDLRTSSPEQYAKLLTKSFANYADKLYIPTYKFDKHSLGDKPSNEVVIWNLHSTTPSILIKNHLSQYGDIQEIRMVDDKMTAVPLGMCVVTFDGAFDIAHANALKVVEMCNKKLLIQGRYVRCGLNVKNKLYDEIYDKSVKARNERLEKQKSDELRRKEERERREEMERLRMLQEAKAEALSLAATPKGPSRSKLNLHDQHILPMSAFTLSYKFQSLINNRPYIFIPDKSLSAMHVTSEHLNRHFQQLQHSVSRILQQRSGFYIIFDTLSAAVKCFDSVDGTRFASYTIRMTLYIPDAELPELQARRNPDQSGKNVSRPPVVTTMKSSEMAEIAKLAREKLRLTKTTSSNWKNVADSLVTVKRLDLDAFRKIGVVKAKVDKSFVPVSHALNKLSDDETEDDDDIDDEDENNDETGDDETGDDREEDKKRKTEANESSEPDEPVSKRKKSESLDAVDIEMVETPNDAFQPSTSPPGPVYEELYPFQPTLAYLKESIMTNEDFDILKSLSSSEKPSGIKNLQFWAWQHENYIKTEAALNEHHKVEDGEEVEDFDFRDEVLHNVELKSISGSFKTEPYKKIPDKLKREYLIHRRKLTNLNPVKHDDDDETNATVHNKVQSSRVNRANTRRFVADVSAQKQIIGETDLLDLNQLNKRKKPVQFARSAIHNWGLYALEPINAGEMIIEYVGERIRQQIAELREKKYLRSGIGSSYLFRVDENTVIDASKKGGIARFINHCCEPSCTAKIIKVDGSKRIVIYALRDVKKNEELTYDYKFERETNDDERIVCLCGAPGCKGYLN